MRIALVSDFFYPSVGGAEVHVYQLGSYLRLLGHHVIVITHALREQRGVRLLKSGLKVFYISQLPFYNNTSFPTIFGSLPLVRDILIRERIELVHGHSAFSVLTHEAMLHAAVMGLHTCFTDHSLFGFQDASAILTNKLLKASLAGASSVICVSHASKENTVLRAHIDPSDVSVIGNAIDATHFVPRAPSLSSSASPFFTIVFCARLELRKGADLLAMIIPRVCAAIPNVRFVVAGDGRKRPLIEDARDAHGLGDRVVLLGNVAHSRVPQVLQEGQLFLNTSLTEAFCMAIVEAACAGLHVVSTNVGGIPEVLPQDLVTLAEPTAEDLYQKIIECVPHVHKLDPWERHRRVAAMYDWSNVAKQTEEVYAKAMSKKREARDTLTRYRERCGVYWGRIFCMFFVFDLIFFWILQFLFPTRAEMSHGGGPVKGILKNSGKPDQSSDAVKPPAKAAVVWDEQNIEKNELEKPEGGRQKIDEPKTPYKGQYESEEDEEHEDEEQEVNIKKVLMEAAVSKVEEGGKEEGGGDFEAKRRRHYKSQEGEVLRKLREKK